jgi:hypothetical protein
VITASAREGSRTGRELSVMVVNSPSAYGPARSAPPCDALTRMLVHHMELGPDQLAPVAPPTASPANG